MVFFRLLPVAWVWQQHFLAMDTGIFELESRLVGGRCLIQNASQTLFNQRPQAGLAFACQIFSRHKKRIRDFDRCFHMGTHTDEYG